MDIVSKVKNFVSEECRKPRNKYAYEIFTFHLCAVNKYARKMAEKFGGNIEIVELASWLHDIGLIQKGRESHHITGAEITERTLLKYGYDKGKTELVRQCVYSHRGSENIERVSLEEQIIADADAMAHFDTIGGLFKVNFELHPEWGQGEVTEFLRGKYTRSYNKLSDEARKIIQPKYDAAMLLL